MSGKGQDHRGCPKRPCTTCRKWDQTEDAVLRELVGTAPVTDVADRLNARFAGLRPPRTLEAVKNRANGLGLWFEYTEGFTMRDLEQVVGWGNDQIIRHWIAPGLLRARKVRGRGHDGRWQVLDADLAAFIDTHLHAYDWRLFGPGPWRSRAEVAQRRSPWRTVEDLLGYCGLRWRNVWEKRWREIPHVRRHHVLGRSNHALGQALIDQALFPEIRASLDLNRYARRGAFKKQDRRDAWRRRCGACDAVTIGVPEAPVPARCWQCGTAHKNRRGLAA